MKNRYQKAFDEISPIRSDEELLRAVLDRKAENMKTTRKIGKKAIVILAAAAVVLGMTTVGVGAAYQWDLSAAFADLFQDRYERYNDEDFEKETFDFSKISKEIGKSFEGEGYTLTVDGVVATSETAYFIYTIRFGEDFPYDYGHHEVYGTGWFDWDIELFGLEFSLNGEPWNATLNKESSDCRWLDERTMRGVFRLNSNGLPLENKTLTLTIGSLFRSRLENHVTVEEQTVECGFSVDVTLDEDMVYKAVTFASNEPITLDGIGGAVITEITVSPFGINYTVIPESGREIEHTDLWYAVIDRGVASVTLRDGSVMETNTTTGDPANGGIKIFAELVYPVDPAEVVSVTICGYSFEPAE